MSYRGWLTLATKFSVIPAYLKNGLDKHGIGVGKAKKSRLGVRGIFKTRNGPDHSRMLHKSAIEKPSSFGFR